MILNLIGKNMPRFHAPVMLNKYDLSRGSVLSVFEGSLKSHFQANGSKDRAKSSQEINFARRAGSDVLLTNILCM